MQLKIIFRGSKTYMNKYEATTTHTKFINIKQKKNSIKEKKKKQKKDKENIKKNGKRKR